MKKLIFLFIIFFCSTAFSQQTYFEKYWGDTTANDFARSVRQLPNGDIFVFGYSNAAGNGDFDFALNKLDRYGNLTWTKFYGTALNDNGLYMNTTADGNLICVGESQSANNGLDVLLYKIDTAGSVIWSQRYSTPVNESGKFVRQTSDGGYAICGFQNDQYSSNDSYVIKTDALGNKVWDVPVGGISNDVSDMLVELPSGNLVVTADSKSGGSGGYDVELFEVDKNGNVVWDGYHGDSYNQGCQGLYLTPDNYMMNVGETEISMFSAFNFFIEKFDTLANSKWKKVFGGINADAAFSLCPTPDNGFMLCGYSNSYNSGAPLDLVVFKTDSLGNMLWIQGYGGPGIDIGYEIVPSVYNGYLICGNTDRNNSSQFYLLHLDQGGTTTGIPESKNTDGIFLYPNPSNGLLQVHINHPAVKNIFELYSPGGQLVYSSRFSSGQFTADLRGKVSPGVYFARISDGETISVKKIVIK